MVSIKGDGKKREPARGDSFSTNFIARGELIQAIQQAIKEQGWTQGEAAKFFGVAQPRISELMHGRIDRFTVDMLMLWLEKLGKDVGVTVRSNVFASKEKIQLTLYILGNQQRQAETMIDNLFGGDSSKYELTVVDVLEDAQAAKKAHITATPCLVKEAPGVRAVFVGDLSAASIRWQLSVAELHARDTRETAQELRQANQDQRDVSLNAREQRQDQRDVSLNEHEKRNRRS